MDDLISVIVPVYNVEKYLGKCLDSIIGQTYHNLEIILVNDGSTDSSESIMRRYALDDSRICCVSKEDEGVSSARNAGIQMAHGRYLLFVDADDYIEKDMIEILYYKMDDEVDIAACGYVSVDDHERRLTDRGSCQEAVSDDEIFDENSIWEVYFQKSATYCVVVWNKLFRRELLEGMEFAMGRFHEDEFFFNSLIKKGFMMKCISRRLYCYRVRNQSLMAENNIQEIRDAVDAYAERMYYFADRHMFQELDILFRYSIGLLTRAVGRKKPENKKEILLLFAGFKRQLQGLLELPLSIRARLKAKLFLIAGSPFVAVRCFLKGWYAE